MVRTYRTNFADFSMIGLVGSGSGSEFMRRCRSCSCQSCRSAIGARSYSSLISSAALDNAVNASLHRVSSSILLDLHVGISCDDPFVQWNFILHAAIHTLKNVFKVGEMIVEFKALNERLLRSAADERRARFYQLEESFRDLANRKETFGSEYTWIPHGCLAQHHTVGGATAQSKLFDVLVARYLGRSATEREG